MKLYLDIRKKIEWIYFFNCILIYCCNSIKSDVNKRPQEPKKPYPYHEEEVFYLNKNADIKISGTLTFPKSKVTFPAVILITGQGAQDRNVTIQGHRPFLILSDYLTRRGFAVLRSDDRTIWREAYDFSEPDRFAGKFTDSRTRNILMFDPLPTVMNVKCTILFLFGGKDVQVSATQNSILIEEAFRKGGKKNFQMEVF
jgi:hypothetical protein